MQEETTQAPAAGPRPPSVPPSRRAPLPYGERPRVAVLRADALAEGDEFLSFLGRDNTVVLRWLQRFVEREGCGRRVRAITEEAPGLMAVSIDRVNPAPLLVAGSVDCAVILRPAPAVCPAVACAEVGA